jgi:hypothetical protein
LTKNLSEIDTELSCYKVLQDEGHLLQQKIDLKTRKQIVSSDSAEHELLRDAFPGLEITSYRCSPHFTTNAPDGS